MKEIINDIVAIAVGITAGIIFYGGLWITVRKGLQSRNALMLIAASFILRFGFLLTMSYFFLMWHVKMLILFLAGFTCVRILSQIVLERKKHATQKTLANETQS